MGRLTPKINECPKSFFHRHLRWCGLVDDDVINCVDCSCDHEIIFVCNILDCLNSLQYHICTYNVISSIKFPNVLNFYINCNIISIMIYYNVLIILISP